jgi:hypothetical protein
MATATEGAAMLLVVADAAGNVSVADPDGSTVHGPVELSGPAVDLSGQPWAYALQTAGGASRMQAVGIPRVVAGSIDPVGPPVGFAGDAKELAVASGAVYVAYDGTTGEPGGVAVFDVVQGDCADILWESLDGCDDCDEPNCVVLATITGYRPGFAMLDPADPPTDPADDLSAGSARIDNRAGRRLLPSTSTLTDVITCLLDQGGGGQGPAGPPGPGLEAGLVRITALSWTHDKPIQVNSLQTIVGFPGAPTERYGVIIAFTAEVSLDGIDAIHVFQVEAPSLDLNGEEAHYGYACRCPIRGSVVPVQPSINGNLVTKGRVLVGADHASAIAFVFDPVFVANVLLERDISDLWVRLRGDFVLDTGNPARAIDAEFVRHDFDTGDRPRGSALGVQGGIFESWFEPRRH